MLNNHFKLLVTIVISLLILFINISISPDCRLCPEIIQVKILLKNGVIRKGHVAVDPQEELSTKPDRALEVMKNSSFLRLFLSLETNQNLNSFIPHILYDKVYLDIPYKDIANIQLLEKHEN